MRGHTMLGAMLLVAACGPPAVTRSTGPATDPARDPDAGVTPTTATPPGKDDPRVEALSAMTDLLDGLANQIQHITEDQAPSKARCTRLADAVSTWGEAHYEAYEIADGEGAYLGITKADADNQDLRRLARQLAYSSSLLIDLVDEDCLYGSGAYGDILYDYLVGYQGLAHWVKEGDTRPWEYEQLVQEAEAERDI
ncbi:MAG: hypothetical protein H6709_24030 [Kofleriaceae bacterium]|nr:hypothetical protein [Myxococcales bacterium]MCB9559984.1 hypothetical protein [Kofleriaceae bacterium]MCB9575157.1 hypothetical protein [Kofleriaceae bacterium]